MHKHLNSVKIEDNLILTWTIITGGGIVPKIREHRLLIITHYSYITAIWQIIKFCIWYDVCIRGERLHLLSMPACACACRRFRCPPAPVPAQAQAVCFFARLQL